MAVTATITPNPVTHSAAYFVFVNGLTAGHAISVNTYSSGAFADTPITGVADAQGVFSATITAQAPLGVYILVVEDTTPTPDVVVLTQSFIVA